MGINIYRYLLTYVRCILEKVTENKNNINWTIHTSTHTLIYIQIGIYTIYWLLDRVSSSLHKCQMFTECSGNGIGVMFTIMHCCKHDTDILTNSRSLLCIYLTSMERGAHPVKELINCVHFYLNKYKSMCVIHCLSRLLVTQPASYLRSELWAHRLIFMCVCIVWFTLFLFSSRMQLSHKSRGNCTVKIFI